MTDYRYKYDSSGTFERGPGGDYDEETRAVMAGNVSRSLELDSVRTRLAPSASEVAARAAAERKKLSNGSNGNGNGHAKIDADVIRRASP